MFHDLYVITDLKDVYLYLDTSWPLTEEGFEGADNARDYFEITEETGGFELVVYKDRIYLTQRSKAY